MAAANVMRRYSPAMMAIHWTTVVLLVAAFGFAWAIPDGPGQGGVLLMLHKSIGLAVLALAAMRLVLRNTSRLPPEEGGIAWIEAAGARTVHVLLYVILFAMPLSGYLSESARGHAVSVFGLFDILPLSPVSPALRSVAWTIHNTGQFAVYAVVGLHVSAALFHLVVRRDGVMARMLPEFSQHRRVVSVHHAAE